MLRGYRNFILAFGLIFGGTEHAYAEEKKESVEQSIAASLKDIAAVLNKHSERVQSPDKQAEPCKPGDDRRYSDLCAQWKAADAAADSAWWAWVAAVSATVGTFAVLVAIGFTYQANAIARDTARRQLRAYIGVGAATITQIENGSGFVVQAELVNSGNTPAYNMRIMGESFADSYPMAEERPFIPVGKDHASPVMPGESFHCAYSLHCDDAAKALAEVLSGKCGFYIQGICEYLDAFNERRETHFRYVFGGRIANTGGLVMHAAATGNSAT